MSNKNKLHIIIDFMHIYYKYYFTYKTGRLRRLTYKDKDISIIYYVTKQIEQIRKEWEDKGAIATVTICLDSISKRKDDNEEYKSRRKNKLLDEDFQQINEITELFRIAGYNVVKIDGYEADDIIFELNKRTGKQFEGTVIYTNDKDILVNVNDDTIVAKFKPGVGYKFINKDNYENALFEQFKCYIPYNTIGIYLATVGDKSDDIVGVKGFGNNAFEKLIEEIYTLDGEHEDFGDFNNIENFFKEHNLISRFKLEGFEESLKLVRNKDIEEDIAIIENGSNLDKRIEAYSRYEFKSLYN